MSFIDIRKLMVKSGMHAYRGAGPATLHLFEKTHGIRLPEQVKENYLVMNGMETLSKGPLSLMMTRFWPIEEWRRAGEMFPGDEEITTLPADLFIFADYAVESFWFGIDLTDRSVKYGSVQEILGLRDGVIAPSFARFIADIEAGTDSIF